MTPKQIDKAISKVITFNKLSHKELIFILTKIKIDREKKCWFFREDWSEYVTFKKQRLHRLIFETFKEKINGEHLVCHKCDRPGCINPDHLYQGTHSDNMKDVFKRNRRTTYFGGKVYSVHSEKYKEWEEQATTRQICW
jgi:hypothetical protein